MGFIEKAQAPGSSLDAIAMRLELVDLARIQTALTDLLHLCRKTGQAHACPDIEAWVAPRVLP